MFRFFRNIRQKLFQEGKVSRYLGYAIGEIVLIVVGILIALEANEWKVERRDNALEKHYLERIISDLKQDLIEIEAITQDSFYKMMVGNHVLKQFGEEDYIQALINSNKEFESKYARSSHNTFVLDAQYSFTSSENPKEPPFGFCIRLLSTHRDVDIRNYTYNELIANGRFEVIGNSRIRRLISDYYGQQADRSSVRRYIIYGEEFFNEAKSKYNLPAVSEISFEDFLANNDDINHFIAALKNLIYSHVQSHAPYYLNTRRDAVSLSSDLEEYVKAL